MYRKGKDAKPTRKMEIALPSLLKGDDKPFVWRPQEADDDIDLEDQEFGLPAPRASRGSRASRASDWTPVPTNKPEPPTVRGGTTQTRGEPGREVAQFSSALAEEERRERTARLARRARSRERAREGS